ncbi:hypothetical protein BT96DRAFT_182877 [Gymnopus androsaceus JB14]|uniref:Protein kinase domain-containing protein n=1 Tax=Gymnopus androsaceus JB14 TaxID=1447944 RepID=A0A6A4HBK2_9AGAR|nr:hypothetical protein BT96DRAFT_182877 [Gymnopus androsaceus JB14]
MQDLDVVLLPLIITCIGPRSLHFLFAANRHPKGKYAHFSPTIVLPGSCLRLDLKQRIGGGAIGTTYRATLTIGSDSTRCEDVVVKLANNDDRSRKHLRHEFFHI